MEYYLLFSLSVGIWACLDLIPEVRHRLFEANRLDDVMYDRPMITFIVMLVMGTIFAPMTALTILVPSWRAKAINNMV